MTTTRNDTRTFPFYPIKGGDTIVIGGRAYEVSDTRPVIGGYEAYGPDGRTIITVWNDETPINVRIIRF